MSEVNDISKAKVVYGTHAGMKTIHAGLLKRVCV